MVRNCCSSITGLCKKVCYLQFSANSFKNSRALSISIGKLVLGSTKDVDHPSFNWVISSFLLPHSRSIPPSSSLRYSHSPVH